MAYTELDYQSTTYKCALLLLPSTPRELGGDL
jgi:hypothetical protein